VSVDIHKYNYCISLQICCYICIRRDIELLAIFIIPTVSLLVFCVAQGCKTMFWSTFVDEHAKRRKMFVKGLEADGNSGLAFLTTPGTN